MGLGNPGPRYANTPHNIGFEAVEALADRHGLRFRRSLLLRGWTARWQTKAGRVTVLKPATFMNRSGQAVARALFWLRLKPENLVVVYDDLELPLGKLRLRPRGGAGSHNGMKSILASLGGEQSFSRLRIGVGPRPPGEALIEFVLGPWPEAALSQVSDLRTRAADALEQLVLEGAAATMNRVNAGESLNN